MAQPVDKSPIFKELKVLSAEVRVGIFYLTPTADVLSNYTLVTLTAQLTQPCMEVQ